MLVEELAIKFQPMLYYNISWKYPFATHNTLRSHRYVKLQSIFEFCFAKSMLTSLFDKDGEKP